MLKNILTLLVLLLPLQAIAVIETYQFSDDDSRARYQEMIDDLRCPKCQNQNLSGSNSPIAKDLRREVHRLIGEGQSDESIKAFMVKRYGNFVLYEPPVDEHTYVIWGLPVIFLFIAFVVVLMLKIKLSRNSHEALLGDHDKQRLLEILNKYS